MEIRFTLTMEDYREGNRLWLLNSTLRRKLNYNLFVRFGYWIGIPLFSVALILFFANLFAPAHRMGAAMSGVAAAAAWIGLIFIVCPFTYGRKIARSFREQKLPSERTLKADESGVHVARTDGAMESRMGWTAFDKAIESNSIFVLFPNLRTFVPVPKRAMTAEQQREFRTLVAAHVPGAAGQPVAIS
jgi:hypothetical protein